ncbi:vacuolar protein sorting-associated protein 13A-like isoform X4 [Haliotis rufescens]|uniref:vacuolar protein sorting-associated protein 13A-like isoform X4 n=1 Tax=Haliotis rufescens TaxID=6454 RepID=UPI00201F0370|nr:vacuolar protein sorting-associated protein 13A-like isoform X4 [Haliotis rufescens]
MVFESLVVELINKFVGDYVENLDASQLKLGIWGGDAVLQNLDLKQSALDDLDLPVKIKAGHVGKLTLKIPWKNLYTEPVIAQLDGIYALAVPNAGIKYNAEKEEKAKQEAKQKKLKQIEERKKAEADKDKPKEEKPDTFVEKMATQVIKNLQIKVNNIHVRYEDRFTNPKRPFAIGITLQELLFQTTDESWQPCVIKDAVTQIFKLIRLDSLGVYWDSCTKMYDSLPKEDILNTLKSNIAAQNAQTDYQYLVKPISSVAHLKLNPKPEKNQFTLPKIFMTIVFDNIAVALSKLQYDDMLEMLEAFERTALLGLYRKYKPDVPLHNNAKAWWHYAYNAVLEETVRRRRRMFSWSHIIQHRLAMKRYREAYVKKLDKGKASGDVQKAIDECEKLLDVLSITLMKQQAEVEAAKLGAQRKEEQGSGWFGGWFGGKKKKATEKPGNDIQEKFYEQFSLDEKNKLYGAIGYEENESDPTLPIDYIAVRLVTKLNNVSVSLRDPTKKDPQVLRLQLKDVFTSVGQRPAASAVSVEAKIDRLSVFGTPQNNATPKMVTSLVQEADQVYSLLSINLETNPLDGLADTRVKVSSRPLEIAYDAITVNQLGDFFKPPKSVRLKQLSQAAMAKFDEVKEQSATGLQHSIEQHKYTEISVDLMSSYVLVPEGGLMKKGVKMLLLDLGSLKVSSEKNQSQQIKGKMDSLEEVMARAYDKFNIQLARIQLLFIHPGEDWHKARWAGQSDMHILRPISINIDLQKCMFDKDPRMAKMKVAGELPLLSLSISDYRLQEIMALAQGIPTGGGGEAAPPDEVDEEIFKGPNTMVSVAGDEGALLNRASKIQVQQGDKPAEKTLQRTTSQEFINATDMELKFEIKEILINVAQREGATEAPLLKLVIESVGTQVKMRTFDMVVEAYVGCLYLQHLKFKASDTMAQQLSKVRAVNDGSLINIINTPNGPGFGKLLMVQYVKANKEGPEFLTTYKNTEQAITVVFSGLELLLHQGAIISLLEFAQKLQPPSSPATASQKEQEKKEREKKEQEKKEQEKKEQEKTKDKKPPRKKKGMPEDPNLIDILVNAEMKSFAVAISSDEKLLTDIKINGIDARVAVQKAQTTVAAVLKDMTIYNPTPDTLYPKILGIEGSEVLKLDVVAYNNGTAGDKYGDMSCMDTKVDVALGCIRLVFLNRYVTDLLAFLDNFQAAKAKIAEAGEAMAEYSADAVQSLQETASRIGLNIAMKAPLIIVPQKSTSSSVLLADLGNLEIANSFHLAGKNSPNNVPAVLDKMNIVLSSLKLSRAVLVKTGQVEAEVLLLEPVTISVFVNRNLSAAWYHDQPDMDLGGTLEALTVKMSQGDFTMTMSVLNDNLSEGQSPAKTSSKTDVVPAVEPAVQASQTSTTAAAPGSAQQTQAVTEPPTQLVYTKMKFNFQIKSISVTLYSGESKLTTGVCQREAIKALGKVALMMFALDGSMMSDTSMVTKVILRDTILDDLRPQSQKGISRLLRMIQRSTTTSRTSTHTANMIDVNFKQNATQDKNIDVKMSSLHVCVCVEFLMTLGDFFTKGMPTPPAGSTTTDVEKAPSTTTPASTASPAPAAPVPPTSEMVITLEIEKPDIILVEDQKNTSSNALMLNLGLMFKLRNTPDVQSMQASIKRLQIISCVFNKRDKPGTEVLQPCDISFISSAPYGKDHHMDINITDLVLNISPAIISTMAAISAGFATKPAEEEGPSREPVPVGLWTIKKVEECNFWYLKSIEEGLAADTEPALTNGEVAEEVGMQRGEQLILNLPSLVIKLEGGVGHRTVPLLIVESAFQAEVRDWSSKLLVDSSLLLEVAYYNEKLAVWEPLVEPILEDGKPRRWELGLEVVQNDDLPPLPPEDAEDTVVLPLPKMSVSIKSTDAMQLTMSKACLEVLTNLGKAFNDAYNLVEPSAAIGEVLTPYVIENYTGMDIVLKLDTSFETPTHAVSGRVKLQSGKKLPLSEKIVAQSSTKASVIKATQEGVERKIIFLVEEFGATREVTIKRAEKRMFQINKVSHSGDKWAIVANTQAHIGQKIVALQSLIQVKNHLDQAVEVYYRGDTRTDSCGVAPPGGIFNIPLHAIYSSSSELYFRPVEGYDMCKEPFRWRAAENDGVKQCACPSRQSGHSAFYFNVSPEVENIFFEAGEEPSAKSYVLHLYPTVILHNLLPFPITYMLEGMAEQQTLQKGVNIPLFHASINESSLEVTPRLDIVIPDYQGKEWIGRRTLQKNVPELSVWNFESHDGTQKTAMDLGLHCKVNEGSFDVTVYSPYWMLNKTGQSLCYKGSDADVVLDHAADNEDVVLFSFKAKTLFGTKKKEKEKDGTLERKGKVKEMKQSGKAQLKIGDTDWSDKFSLDTVGSSGTVQCKSNKRVFEVGVKISLTSSGLTKIVTFTPFYMMLNTAEYSILCTEATETESWVEVVPGKCLPFWPEQSGKEMTMKAKVKDSDERTAGFLINKAHTSLMRLNNEYGGINTECQVTESAMVTTFKAYKSGMATVQIVNFTDKSSLTFFQSGVKNSVHELGPNQTQLYTWENSLGKREMVYTCGNKKDVKNDLSQDGIGEFFFDSDTKVYWVSFLDGMQRVLLFTQDLALATVAQQAGELERIELEVNICIQGLGLSLVNNYNQTEVAFLGITSSGIIWEEKRKRYKAIKMKDGMVLEMAYQRHLAELAVGKTPNARMVLENKFDVDFSNKDKMMMFKPNKREIRRSFVDGIWLQYKTSAHQLQFHAKINRLQLDSQLKGAVFPTILAPIPPPKSVAAESVPKPFTEISLMQRKHEHSNIAQIKYAKVLIQEFAVKVDQGFLNALLELFASGEPVSREQETKEFEADVKKTDAKLMDVVGLSLAEEQKNFYDYLHLSPIKIHLSFSLQGGGGDDSGKPTQLHSNVLNIFMQSVGVVLTDVQDVVFKLGYFERSHTFYNQSQLVGEMTRHYAGQAIKQMYVLVLGLDVLGNPFGLLRGLSEGAVDLFYEPCQGAIQGPEEFAEGLALGVRSLFGHAVGGAAGAVSRITGTLGKGVAALTLDDDYQKKRREQLNKRPANAREGFARGGKGLVMGVFDGVTGIVRKPLEGAQEEGAKGFFKGIGKGLVGVVTRPTSGVIDFASSSFEGIRRIAEMSDEVRRLRPPRRFHNDKVIRPYNHQEAEGYAILQETEKGKYAASDEYLAHVVISKDGKLVFLVLDKRILLAKRGEIFGSWDCDWTYTWPDLKEGPKKTARGIEIILKEKEKKKFFGSSSSKKEVPISDPATAERIVTKIEEAMARMK